MANAQKNLNAAIVDKLRADTGAGSLVALTKHLPPDHFGIGRDMPVKKGVVPYLGIKIFQSVPLIDDGPSDMQVARVHFRCYSTKELTAIDIADRIEFLLQARAEQAAEGTNIGYYDFTSTLIRNAQTRYKTRDNTDFDNETDIWNVQVEADLIWIDIPCPP